MTDLKTMEREIYSHWSQEPVLLTKRTYTQTVSYKPCGFWFDVDKDWKRWCEGASFRMEHLTRRHPVDVDIQRVLALRSGPALDDFTLQYGVPYWPNDSPRDFRIHWPTVAQDYAGILIAPYCWERRLDLMWYYGWDCASGCIWDISAITLGEPE